MPHCGNCGRIWSMISKRNSMLSESRHDCWMRFSQRSGQPSVPDNFKLARFGDLQAKMFDLPGNAAINGWRMHCIEFPVKFVGNVWKFCRHGIMEVNRWRNRKSLLRTLIRDRSGREKSWFLQGNACQGNSSKLQSLIAGVCRTFTGMQSWYSDKLSAQNMTKSPCGVIIFQGLDGTSETLFFKSLRFFYKGG